MSRDMTPYLERDRIYALVSTCMCYGIYVYWSVWYMILSFDQFSIVYILISHQFVNSH